MTTIAKAADLIGQALSEYPSYKYLEIATALDNAGLLAPNLPEPTYKFETGAATWELTPETVVSTWNIGNSYYPRVLLDIGDGFILYLEEARALAHMLLAAANQAEAQAREMTNG